MLRELCVQHGIELVEGHTLPDHIYLLLSIPPKFSVVNTIGFVKGKSAIQIHRKFLGRQRNFTGFSLLGKRVLRQHSIPGRRNDSQIHP